MHSHSQLLNTPEQIYDLCEELKNQEIVALDTEFIREQTFFPIIALIQVATKDQSWLLDPLILKKEDLKPFLDFLINPKILKIFHAATADQECLYTNYGLVASPHFDTAIGASLCGYGDSIGLSKLVNEVLGIFLQKGHARTNWMVRPLPEQLLHYAHLDVEHLIPLSQKLFKKLEEKERKNWAFELCAHHERVELYQSHPENLTLKILKTKKMDRRTYATFLELMKWREKRARSVDVPRRRIVDDNVLMDLALVRPKDMNHLSAFRGLHRAELKHSGQEILTAIEKVNKLSEDHLPRVPHANVANAIETRLIELLHCFVKVLAQDLDISSRHLATTETLLALIRNPSLQAPQDLIHHEILTSGACKLIGEDLLAMVHGKRALWIQEKNVKALNL